jgi:phospholipase/carboxylesterase
MTTQQPTGELDGPLYGPYSGGAVKQIVLLLHGYGSNGNDLISFSTYWRELLPDALFIAPNAPEQLPGTWSGYQWWALTEFSREAMARGVASAAPKLNRYIDWYLKRHNLTEREMVLVGFSQGTMMALHVGPRRERPFAGILGYSGMLADAEELARELRSKPPVMLIHGAVDQMVPVSAMRTAQADLEALGFDVSSHVCPGLDHSVDQAGLQLGVDFCRRMLTP